MSDLTSVETQNLLSRAVTNQEEDSGFHGIAIKDLNSGLCQETSLRTAAGINSSHTLGRTVESTHLALLGEIDSTVERKSEGEKPLKKQNTLTRMLKGFRGEKAEEGLDKEISNKPFSKIFQRVNPIGKSSRENISKVIHRIGDALYRKPDQDFGVVPGGTVLKNTLDINANEKDSELKSCENSNIGISSDEQSKTRNSKSDKDV